MNIFHPVIINLRRSPPLVNRTLTILVNIYNQWLTLLFSIFLPHHEWWRLICCG